MLDYLAYGAIGVAFATAILTFRLLSREQKKEQPNESILKMIKWFMGLTVLFSLFFGVIEILDNNEMAELSIETATKYLSESDSTEFVLNSTPGSEEASVYVNYAKDKTFKLGALKNNSQVDLKGTKGKDKSLWHIVFGSTILGKVKLDVTEHRLIADSTEAKHFKVSEWYALDGSDFWFRINSITGKSPNYFYNVSYGEGKNRASIIPSIRSLDYSKTPDGYLQLSKPFKHVRHDDWKRQYYVKFGAGLATHNSTSVQRLNVHVIGLNVD